MKLASAVDVSTVGTAGPLEAEQTLFAAPALPGLGQQRGAAFAAGHAGSGFRELGSYHPQVERQ